MINWSDSSVYYPSWEARAKQAAKLLEPGDIVCEIGCGPNPYLAKILDPANYLPCDLIPWHPRVAVCDLDARDYPFAAIDKTTVIVLLGVLEWVKKPLNTLYILANSGKDILFSYHSEAAQTIDPRWTPIQPIADIKQTMFAAGYRLVAATNTDDDQYIQRYTHGGV